MADPRPTNLSTSHSDLYQMRQGKDIFDQSLIAPLEHRAFAREAVGDNKLMAAPLLVAPVLYQLSKAMGFERSRSPADVEQLFQSWAGIIDGLTGANSTESKVDRMLKGEK